MAHSSCVQLEAEGECNANQMLQAEINKYHTEVEVLLNTSKSSVSALSQDHVQEIKTIGINDWMQSLQNQ